MAFLAALPGLLGLAGSIFGGVEQNNQASQLQQQAGQDSAAMGQIINSDMLPLINSMLQSYQQNYAPTTAGLGDQYSNFLNSMNLGGQYGSLTNAFDSPGGATAATGVNAAGITGQDLGYLTNPNATNLQGVAPGAMNLYAQTAAHGLSPQVIGQAENSQQVQETQNLNSIRNSLGSSLPNLAGTTRDMGYSNAQANAQLGSNLAAQNQGLMLQGAGLETGLASQVDQQTQQMLNQGQQTAQGFQGYELNNMLQALNAGTGIMGQAGQFSGQGQNLMQMGQQGLSGIAGMYGNAASAAQQMAMGMYGQNNPFSSIGSVFSGPGGQGLMNWMGGGGAPASAPGSGYGWMGANPGYQGVLPWG